MSSNSKGRPAAKTAISIQGVSKRFVLQSNRASSIKEALLRRSGTQSEEFWALQNVSFDIPKGSFFGIIGHNGSGKSTLLRLIAGIHKPTSGTIRTSGRISALLELGSGFHPDLTGRENIYLNGAMLGLRKQQMAAAVNEIIDFSGIGSFIDSPVKVYSSGMHVRLGFAIAVHVKPEILLVDEVLAVGDEEFQRKCLDHIHTLRRQGVTIVLVAHSPQLMQTMCDEVAWLDHGELQVVGDPSDAVGGYIRRVNTQENARLSKEQAQDRAAEDAIRTAEAAAAKDSERDSTESSTSPTSPEGDSDQSLKDGQAQEPIQDAIDSDRRGSGEIRVLHLQYLDGHGQPTAVGSSGDPLTIRIWYEATSTIERPTFGLGIYHEHGLHVAAIDDKTFGVTQPIVEIGTGYVEIKIDRLILLAGTYYLTTGVYSQTQMHCYDSWHLAHKLVVQPGSSNQYNALVELQAQFFPATSAELS